MAADGEPLAVVSAVLFGVFFLASIFNLKLTHFRVYALSALSALMRTLGFSFRAAYLVSLGDGAPNTDFAAVDAALSAAGFGISLAVLSLIMGCWFKNASPAAKPACADRAKLTVAVRLLIAPIVAFGPICGVAVAVLTYGSGTPADLATAATLRKAATWGILGALLLLTALIAWAAWTAARPAAPPADRLVGVTLALALVLAFVAILKSVALYEPQYNQDQALYYPLLVLPQLIELGALCWPRLLARLAMGARYVEWQEGATLGWAPAGKGVAGAEDRA